MCVVSMVHDHFDPLIPSLGDLTKPWNVEPSGPTPFVWPPTPQEAIDYRKLAEAFREAVDAAKTVDLLTKQPDCVDPEKAKLEARVAELERRLDALTAIAKPAKKRKPLRLTRV